MREEERVEDWLTRRIASVLGVGQELIAPDTPFVDLGLSSVQAVELSDDLQLWTGLTLSPTLAYDYPTIEAVADHLADEVRRHGLGLSASTPPLAR